MKQTKRILSILLAVLLVAAFIPLAFAEEVWTVLPISDEGLETGTYWLDVQGYADYLAGEGQDYWVDEGETPTENEITEMKAEVLSSVYSINQSFDCIQVDYYGNLAWYDEGEPVFQFLHQVLSEQPEVIDEGSFGTITWSLTSDGTLTVGGTGAIEALTGDDTFYPWEKTVAQKFGLQSMDTPFIDPSEENMSAAYEVLCFLKTIIVDEGITAIGDNVFFGFAPEKISIASTVETLGADAFMGAYAKEIIILNPTLSFENNSIQLFGYDRENPQYVTPDVLRDAYFSYSKGSAILNHIMPYISLSMSIADTKYYWNDHFEEMKPMLIQLAQNNFGIEVQDYDELLTVVMSNINETLHTNFTDVTEMYIPVVDVNGNDTIGATPALAAAVFGGINSTDLLYHDCISVWLGKSLIGQYMITSQTDENGDPVYPYTDEPITVYPWLTVYGYEGSTAQTAAIASGVNFVPITHTHTPAPMAVENEVPATCKDAGSYDEVVYCSVCGNEISRETKTIAKLEHTPGEAVVENEVAATCKVAGSYDEVVYCSECGDEISREAKTIAKLEHTPSVYTQPSTCTVAGYTITTCAECTEQLGFQVLPLADHQFGEWVTVSMPTTTEPGLEERVCTVCHIEKETREIPMLKVFTSTDENTGVSISFGENAYADENVDLVVEEDFTGSQYLTQSYTRFDAWNIKTYINGTEVQPDQPVTVKIPLPAGYDPDHVAVYHINSKTGQSERIEDVRVEDGYIVFTATSFSVYIVVDESTAQDPNTCPWCGKVHSGFFGGLIAFFHRIFARLFGAKY